MRATLFDPAPEDVAVTTDDWYTPRWLFAAAGLMFDMDVCAPVDPAYRTCPACEYLTAIDDGLTAPWRGIVWMNPPYSNAGAWVSRWANHDAGLAIFPAMPEVAWLGALHKSADAVAIVSLDFGRPDGRSIRLRWAILLAARGATCVSALARVAAADPYAQGAYHIRPGKFDPASAISCETPPRAG